MPLAPYLGISAKIGAMMTSWNHATDSVKCITACIPACVCEGEVGCVYIQMNRGKKADG